MLRTELGSVHSEHGEQFTLERVREVRKARKISPLGCCNKNIPTSYTPSQFILTYGSYTHGPGHSKVSYVNQDVASFLHQKTCTGAEVLPYQETVCHKLHDALCGVLMNSLSAPIMRPSARYRKAIANKRRQLTKLKGSSGLEEEMLRNASILVYTPRR